MEVWRLQLSWGVSLAEASCARLKVETDFFLYIIGRSSLGQFVDASGFGTWMEPPIEPQRSDRLFPVVPRGTHSAPRDPEC